MQLTILATSDMHGYIQPTNYAEKGADLPFGTAKVVTKMQELTAQADGPVIKIENGDFIQGSPLSYYAAKQKQDPAEITKVINHMGYDVGLLGNHEFNYGLPYLEKAIKSYQHPILAANVLGKDGQPYFGEPYVILEKEGVKIAILGVVTQYIPHWEQPATVKDLTFKSLVATAKEYVPKLRELADVVIVSYHGGFEKDLTTGEATEMLTGENEGYELLQTVSGIDAFVTGHQHREIATVINGVPVIQPGFRGNYIGKITLDLNQTGNTWQVSNPTAEIVATKDAKADLEVVGLIQELDNELENWLDQPVGKVEGDMHITDPMAARIHEHPYIEFINRVQMWASGAKISGTALFNNEGKGFGEIITMRDVITNYIYPNTLAVLKITGTDLKAALEQTANYLVLKDGQIVFNPQFIDPKPQYYNYDMYEGIDYAIDLSKPYGEKITKLQFEGSDILPDQELEVVMNQYRAVGGGNYAMFSADKIIKEIPRDMTEVIAEYLQAHPVLKGEVNHNFSVK